jgi:chaperonin GroES
VGHKVEVIGITSDTKLNNRDSLNSAIGFVDALESDVDGECREDDGRDVPFKCVPRTGSHPRPGVRRKDAPEALRSHASCLTRPNPIHAVTVHLESKPMNVRPLHDRLIIQRLEEGEQKVGGIIIPDTAKEKPQQGKVIAAGIGKVKDDGTRQQPDVKAGDLILFGKYSGQEIKLDGEDYLIMREDDVLGVIEGAHTKTKK